MAHRAEAYDPDDSSKRERRRKKRDSLEYPSMHTAPVHVHGSEWRDMLRLTHQPPSIPTRKRAATVSSMAHASWFEENLTKREGIAFVSSQKYQNRCGCGLVHSEHSAAAFVHGSEAAAHLAAPVAHEPVDSDDGAFYGAEQTGPSTPLSPSRPRWTIRKHTQEAVTDAFGSTHFEGSGHPSTTAYARVSFDTPPALLLHLLQSVWGLPPPKVIITIHGGLTKFSLSSKLARSLRRGILRAAATTDTWIITNGLHQGVLKHVAAAIEGPSLSLEHKQTPSCRSPDESPYEWPRCMYWNRSVGTDQEEGTTHWTGGRLVELEDSHSALILADNGTAGRYGAEIILRRRLEHLLTASTAPVVCLLVEGGSFSIKVANDYLTNTPQIPVVVCDGNGRAANLLALAHQLLQPHLQKSGALPESVEEKLLEVARAHFDLDDSHLRRVVRYSIDCAKRRNLLTVYRHGEESEDSELDHSIFSALLKGQNLSAQDQLHLALAWNRADVAEKEIFTGTAEWSAATLQMALMEALLHHRVAFVHLLLENGVPLHNFLTFERLESLYNTHYGPPSPLRMLFGKKSESLTLPHVGQSIDHLVGFGYQSQYSTADFSARYALYQQCQTRNDDPNNISTERLNDNKRKASHRLTINASNRQKTSTVTLKSQNSMQNAAETEDDGDSVCDVFTFDRPFKELLVWAVLTRRHEMARLMWRHGDEPLAKALVAARLNFSLAGHALGQLLELPLREELKSNGRDFRKLSVELLDACYKANDDMTRVLLTCELGYWGRQTCLGLAYLIDNLEFIGHPCSQSILTEMWFGGMQARSTSIWTVLACLFVPPFITIIEFKSKEELRQQPHTAEKHAADHSGYASSNHSEDEEAEFILF